MLCCGYFPFDMHVYDTLCTWLMNLASEFTRKLEVNMRLNLMMPRNMVVNEDGVLLGLKHRWEMDRNQCLSSSWRVVHQCVIETR